MYDLDGYNQCGYHQESGLSREGVPRPHNALDPEESADAVEPRDEKGSYTDAWNEDGATEDEDEDEDGVLIGWDYEPFDEADLANEGWDNGTWGDDGGAAFLNAENNPNWSDGPFSYVDEGFGVFILAGLLRYANNGYGINYQDFDSSDHTTDIDGQTTPPEPHALGHVYRVPYLGRLVSPGTTINIPQGVPSLYSLLMAWKYWLSWSLTLRWSSLPTASSCGSTTSLRPEDTSITDGAWMQRATISTATVYANSFQLVEISTDTF
jgi:hypothetical protein